MRLLEGTLGFDTDQLPLHLEMDGAVPEGSLSGLYLRVHLPRGANPAKVALALQPVPAPLELTLVFDQPDRRAELEVLATAGASAYAVSLAARAATGEPVHLDGVTGQTLAAACAW